jgi:phospholipase C
MYGRPGLTMDYYDGNTVTAMWNYAQHFAMSDRHFGTTFGPSSIGAINLISGNTHGVSPVGAGQAGTMVANSQPLYDDCAASATASFSGQNIGNLMNAQGVTWGWFAGGFKPTSRNGLTAVCGGSHTNAAGGSVADYLPHHAPFQYYLSTSNPHHLPPNSVASIGTTDQANHLYDLTDFDAALAAGNLPQVSFLKAVSAEDGHPGYSGPLDEQRFIVRTLNALQASPQWDSTAVFIAYDDSDGWYDHVFLPPTQGSDLAVDSLGGASRCGPQPVNPADYRGRCGPGPRLPLVIVSPWARQNFIDHTQTEQTSILKFIELNWNLGEIGDQSFDHRAAPLDQMFDFDPTHQRAPKLILDPSTGNPPGAPLVPSPTPAATPAPTATPARTPTPTPAKVALKLSCKVSGGGKRITVSCSGSGKDVARKTTLRLEILAKKKVVASAKGTLSKKKAKVDIKSRTKLKKGRYTLRISLSQSRRTTITLTKPIRLK